MPYDKTQIRFTNAIQSLESPTSGLKPWCTLIRARSSPYAAKFAFALNLVMLINIMRYIFTPETTT